MTDISNTARTVLGVIMIIILIICIPLLLYILSDFILFDSLRKKVKKMIDNLFGGDGGCDITLQSTESIHLGEGIIGDDIRCLDNDKKDNYNIDTSRRRDLANTVVTINGFDIHYDEDGYVFLISEHNRISEEDGIEIVEKENNMKNSTKAGLTTVMIIFILFQVIAFNNVKIITEKVESIEAKISGQASVALSTDQSTSIQDDDTKLDGKHYMDLLNSNKRDGLIPIEEDLAREYLKSTDHFVGTINDYLPTSKSVSIKRENGGPHIYICDLDDNTLRSLNIGDTVEVYYKKAKPLTNSPDIVDISGVFSIEVIH